VWSEGAAQVAAEQGLKGASFEDAAASFMRAVGQAISADSVRRITEGWGARVAEARAAEVEQVFTPSQEEAPVIAPIKPVGERGNVSTDGHMILVRGEGWKEVKLSVFSAVEVRPAEERPTPQSRRAQDPWVRLSGHSCQAGLWDADTLGRYQYCEGLRRGLEHCPHLSSVNDAAAWIERVTAENFPQAIRIVDWSHAMMHLWQVAHAAFGEGTPRSQEWAGSQADMLWQGQAAEVAQAIGALSSTAHEVVAGQGFFLAHQEQMHYDQYRATGYPIGSGTVESGGKNYVQRRMKRPGRGWDRCKAQGMLAVLSEMHSNRFDYAWERFARPTNVR